MVDYNTKNSIVRILFFPTYIVWFRNIFVTKKNVRYYKLKTCKFTQKMIEMIFRLYEICSIY
jgi:hypothetical protein